MSAIRSPTGPPPSTYAISSADVAPCRAPAADRTAADGSARRLRERPARRTARIQPGVADGVAAHRRHPGPRSHPLCRPLVRRRRDTGHRPRPAAWTSTDARTWTAIELTPVSHYGERSLLSSVACHRVLGGRRGRGDRRRTRQSAHQHLAPATRTAPGGSSRQAPPSSAARRRSPSGRWPPGPRASRSPGPGPGRTATGAGGLDSRSATTVAPHQRHGRPGRRRRAGQRHRRHRPAGRALAAGRRASPSALRPEAMSWLWADPRGGSRSRRHRAGREQFVRPGRGRSGGHPGSRLRSPDGPSRGSSPAKAGSAAGRCRRYGRCGSWRWNAPLPSRSWRSATPRRPAVLQHRYRPALGAAAGAGRAHGRIRPDRRPRGGRPADRARRRRRHHHPPLDRRDPAGADTLSATGSVPAGRIPVGRRCDRLGAVRIPAGAASGNQSRDVGPGPVRSRRRRPNPGRPARGRTGRPRRSLCRHRNRPTRCRRCRCRCPRRERRSRCLRSHRHATAPGPGARRAPRGPRRPTAHWCRRRRSPARAR